MTEKVFEATERAVGASYEYTRKAIDVTVDSTKKVVDVTGKAVREAAPTHRAPKQKRTRAPPWQDARTYGVCSDRCRALPMRSMRLCVILRCL